MSIPIFPGSNIPTPKAYNDFEDAISAEVAEMEDIIDTVMKQGDSVRASTETLEMLELCRLCRLGYQTLDEFEKSPPVQRVHAATLLRTIKTLVEDDRTRFEDNYVHQRMKDTIHRTQPISRPELYEGPTGP